MNPPSNRLPTSRFSDGAPGPDPLSDAGTPPSNPYGIVVGFALWCWLALLLALPPHLNVSLIDKDVFVAISILLVGFPIIVLCLLLPRHLRRPKGLDRMRTPQARWWWSMEEIFWFKLGPIASYGWLMGGNMYALFGYEKQHVFVSNYVFSGAAGSFLAGFSLWIIFWKSGLGKANDMYAGHPSTAGWRSGVRMTARKYRIPVPVAAAWHRIEQDLQTTEWYRWNADEGDVFRVPDNRPDLKDLGEWHRQIGPDAPRWAASGYRLEAASELAALSIDDPRRPTEDQLKEKTIITAAKSPINQARIRNDVHRAQQVNQKKKSGSQRRRADERGCGDSDALFFMPVWVLCMIGYFFYLKNNPPQPKSALQIRHEQAAETFVDSQLLTVALLVVGVPLFLWALFSLWHWTTRKSGLDSDVTPKARWWWSPLEVFWLRVGPALGLGVLLSIPEFYLFGPDLSRVVDVKVAWTLFLPWAQTGAAIGMIILLLFSRNTGCFTGKTLYAGHPGSVMWRYHVRLLAKHHKISVTAAAKWTRALPIIIYYTQSPTNYYEISEDLLDLSVWETVVGPEGPIFAAAGYRLPEAASLAVLYDGHPDRPSSDVLTLAKDIRRAVNKGNAFSDVCIVGDSCPAHDKVLTKLIETANSYSTTS